MGGLSPSALEPVLGVKISVFEPAPQRTVFGYAVSKNRKKPSIRGSYLHNYQIVSYTCSGTEIPLVRLCHVQVTASWNGSQGNTVIFGDPSLSKVKVIEAVVMTGIALPSKRVGLYFHCFTALIAGLFMRLITPA
jgi:hypothetical protein